MKRLIALLLAGIMLLSFMTACGTEDEPKESSEESETREEQKTDKEIDNEQEDSKTEEEPPAYDSSKFISAEAEKLYNIIMENQSVWFNEYNLSEPIPYYEQKRVLGGTLIDLNHDGAPEFITGSDNSISVYRFNGQQIEEIELPFEIFGGNSGQPFEEIRTISPYENGWVIIHNKIIGEFGDSDYYKEYFISVFDFTGDEVTETVKFHAKLDNNQYNRESSPNYCYGYPFLNAEFYIDGVEFKASQEKLDAFWEETNELIREFERANAEEDGDEYGGFYGHLPWFCAGYYPSPTVEEWEEKKVEFLQSLNPAYYLYPSIETDYIYSEESWGSWYRDDEDDESIWKLNIDIVSGAVKDLVNNYYGGNSDYFTTDKFIYDNGGAACKPVIYLYPEEEIDVSINVTFPLGGNFTCTYPDYGNGWNVTASPDGTLINKADGLEYSYLYWEGEGFTNMDFSSGFVVKGADTAKFLQEKLAYLGLTPREYNEFIVYWLPLMQNNEYNLIPFQTTAYEESAVLHISPTPDSVLRVFMAYKPLDKPVNIPEQALENFERTGFSVIEWGGTAVD